MSDFDTLAMLLVQPKDVGHLPAVRHGTQCEKFAKAKLAEALSIGTIYDCGLVVNPNCPYFAAFPDSVAVADGNTVLVECKALFGSREKSVKEVMQSRALPYLSERNGSHSLKTEHSYYLQVQGQMAVKGVQKCFFVVVADLLKNRLLKRSNSTPVCGSKCFPSSVTFTSSTTFRVWQTCGVHRVTCASRFIS